MAVPHVRSGEPHHNNSHFAFALFPRGRDGVNSTSAIAVGKLFNWTGTPESETEGYVGRP